jgi:hypothetical protein
MIEPLALPLRDGKMRKSFVILRHDGIVQAEHSGVVEPLDFRGPVGRFAACTADAASNCPSIRNCPAPPSPACPAFATEDTYRSFFGMLWESRPLHFAGNSACDPDQKAARAGAALRTHDDKTEDFYFACDALSC